MTNPRLASSLSFLGNLIVMLDSVAWPCWKLRAESLLEKWFGERFFLLQKPWICLFNVQSLCYLCLSLLPALI